MGSFFIWKRIISTKESPLLPPTFLFLCKGMHVLKPARFASLFFWHSAWRSGRVGQAQSRCYSHLSAALLPFYFFSLGKKPPPPPCSLFLHLVFAFRLHQSSSPSSSNMHALPWSLVSLQFACWQKCKTFSSPSLLFFFHSKQIITETFFTPFFPIPSQKKARKKRSESAEQSMVQDGDESTTWLMLCPNPRQRKCSCSAKTQIWLLCSRRPKSSRPESSSCLPGELIHPVA